MKDIFLIPKVSLHLPDVDVRENTMSVFTETSIIRWSQLLHCITSLQILNITTECHLKLIF